MTANGSSSRDPQPRANPPECPTDVTPVAAGPRRTAPPSMTMRTTIAGGACFEVPTSLRVALQRELEPSESRSAPAPASNPRRTMFGVGGPSDSRPQAMTPDRAPAAAQPEPLFRPMAVAARRANGPDLDLIAAPKARSWGVLGLLISLVSLLFVGASVGRIEVTAEAPGVLRAPNGLRPLASLMAGSISDVLVQAGAPVEAGQVVVRLESAALRASLGNRLSELDLVRRDTRQATERDRQNEERATLAMQRRRLAILGRIQINQERLVQRRSQYLNFEQLMQQGGASQVEGLQAKEAMQAASETVSSLSSELALLDLEMTDRTREWQERDGTRRTALGRAEANVEEARALLASTEVRAPASGQIESLLVSPGSVVEAGALLLQVVPSGAPRTVVAFVPSREIAFVEVGAAASVEVQSLPVSEFGIARARATRVSSDVATASEVQATLGEAVTGAVVRVELSLVESEVSARMNPHLRSGDRVTVRLHRQERRLISLLFDFVRRWFR